MYLLKQAKQSEEMVDKLWAFSGHRVCVKIYFRQINSWVLLAPVSYIGWEHHYYHFSCYMDSYSLEYRTVIGKCAKTYGRNGSTFVESLCGELLVNICWSFQNLPVLRIFLPTSVLKTALENWTGLITGLYWTLHRSTVSTHPVAQFWCIIQRSCKITADTIFLAGPFCNCNIMIASDADARNIQQNIKYQNVCSLDSKVNGEASVHMEDDLIQAF